MSRATVRLAIQEFLSAAQVPFVGQVYAHPPLFTPDGIVFDGVTPGTGTGAVVYIHLEEQAESRRGLVGPTAVGGKLRTYRVTLICYLLSRKPSTEAVGADNDTFLDGLALAIEQNRAPATPGVIWQWGEGDALGAPDVRVTATMPEPLDLGASQVFSTVDVTVCEWPLATQPS